MSEKLNDIEEQAKQKLKDFELPVSDKVMQNILGALQDTEKKSGIYFSKRINLYMGLFLFLIGMLFLTYNYSSQTATGNTALFGRKIIKTGINVLRPTISSASLPEKIAKNTAASHSVTKEHSLASVSHSKIFHKSKHLSLKTSTFQTTKKSPSAYLSSSSDKQIPIPTEADKTLASSATVKYDDTNPHHNNTKETTDLINQSSTVPLSIQLDQTLNDSILPVADSIIPLANSLLPAIALSKDSAQASTDSVHKDKDKPKIKQMHFYASAFIGMSRTYRVLTSATNQKAVDNRNNGEKASYTPNGGIEFGISAYNFMLNTGIYLYNCKESANYTWQESVGTIIEDKKHSTNNKYQFISVPISLYYSIPFKKQFSISPGVGIMFNKMYEAQSS